MPVQVDDDREEVIDLESGDEDSPSSSVAPSKPKKKADAPAKASKADDKEPADNESTRGKAADKERADSASTSGAQKPAKTRDRRYGKAMNVLDNLGRLNNDGLKLSRDKRRVVDNCLDAADGDEDGGKSAGFIDVLKKAPDVAQTLVDEVKVAVEDGAVTASQAETWQTAIDAYKQHLQETGKLLKRPSEDDSSKLVDKLRDLRYKMRDFQREVLDEVSAALSGEEPPSKILLPSHGSRYGTVQRSEEGGSRSEDVPRRDVGDDRGPPRKGGGKDRAGGKDKDRGFGDRGRGGGRDFRGGRNGRADRRRRQDSRARGASDSRSPSYIDDGMITEFGVPNVYEIRSSEGDWYPGIITRLKSNGNYEAELIGGGVCISYPSVHRREIRLLPRARDWVGRDSRSRSGERGRRREGQRRGRR